MISSGLLRCPNIPFQDVLSVSDSEAESVLNIIKGIVPNINKGSELVVQKKDVFAQLHNIFSIEGLFAVPDFVGYTIIRLISAQIEGLHGRVLTLANILIQLSPVCSMSYFTSETDFTHTAQAKGRGHESQDSS